MKIKLEPCRYCDDGVFLPIPDSILTELGWKVGDTITIDVPMTHKSLVIYKDNES